MLRIFFFVAILFFISSLHAQEKEKAEGKITGRIIDSATTQPIEYATVSLQNQADGKIVNGATANEKGIFSIENVAEGNYKLAIDFIGYKKMSRENIIVSKESPVIMLGDIPLASKIKTLKEAVIVEEKNIIENKIDKMVYNVDKDVTSQTGVASDVMKKIPQVNVDVDGNVELQGNSNIRFLINGKPSIMFGSNIAEVLQSIPANQIQSIEVITSPGAKYDAEGTGGIINIILKKNTAQGVNGNISVSAGTRLENGSFNLYARKGKFGMHAFVSGNAQLRSSTINKTDRTSQDSATSLQLLQNGTSDFSRNGYQSGIGFDWDISSKDVLEGSAGFNGFGNQNSGNANRESIVKDNSGNSLSDINDGVKTLNTFSEYSLNYELGYKRKFKKEDQELEVLYNGAQVSNHYYYEQLQQHVSSGALFNGSHGNNPGAENENVFAINYTHPFTDDIKIETGGKTELSHATSVSDIYLLNTSSDNYDYSTSQSSYLEYRRNVYAGYFSASFPLLNFFEMKTGVRYEYTQAQADFSNSGNVSFKPYNTIVPSAVIAHKFKNEQTIKLSYSRRIERPDYGDMNPFINASDPKNILTGNPDLVPEIGDKVELGYSKNFKKNGNISVTLFARNNTNDIQSYVRYYPTYKIGDSTYTNVSVQTRENIGHENNYGLNFFISIPITEKINLRSNISGFERYIYSGISSAADVHGFNYRANANFTYQVKETLVIELFGNFNSPRINAQGTKPAFTTYNFAFRKQFWNKKASIAFTATNFLSEYVNQKTNLAGDNFTLMNLRQLPYRSFGINFTWKFGKLEFKKEKEAEDMNLANPPSEK